MTHNLSDGFWWAAARLDAGPARPAVLNRSVAAWRDHVAAWIGLEAPWRRPAAAQARWV